MITQKILKERYSYDPESGDFRSLRTGSVVGYVLKVMLKSGVYGGASWFGVWRWRRRRGRRAYQRGLSVGGWAGGRVGDAQLCE